MIFSTYKFILLFLPIVLIGYHIINKLKYYTLSKIWLIVASLVFYYLGSPDFFWYFVGSVVGNYIIGSSISKLDIEKNKKERKILFAIGLIGNVALLGYYKYTNFFINNFNYLTNSNIALKNIILPIGISFFTFQLIAYIVDSYRGETSEYNILDYLLFITFFPQLIVGPIVHHKEMVTQFEEKENKKINWDNIVKGIFLFTLGVAKKILLADPLTTDAQAFFAGGYRFRTVT